MPKTWSPSLIRELIAQAQANGIARAELSSSTEAKLFRFAIYNFRRSQNVGENLYITLDANAVLLEKRLAPIVTIVE